MRISSLHIDRFGARSQFSLQNIADGLNVIHGPNGAGKTTIIQFVRWMLYGEQDELSRNYLNGGSEPSQGSISVRDSHGSHNLQRTYPVAASDRTHPTPPVTLDEFDHFFCVCLDRPYEISQLLRMAANRGFQLQFDQLQLDRVKQLSEQIQSQRDELHRLSLTSGSVESLRRQREAKQQEIEGLRAQSQQRRRELESQQLRLSAEVSAQQELVTQHQQLVRQLEDGFAHRRQQLADEYRHWLAAREEARDRRKRRLAEIDQQSARWQEILSEVRQRAEGMRKQVSSIDDPQLPVAESTDTRFFVRTLTNRLRDVEQDLNGGYEHEWWRNHEAEAAHLRGLLGSAVTSIRDDVTRLAQAVENEHLAHQLQESREELIYLTRVEQELADLIMALHRQRVQLGRESDLMPDGLNYESRLRLLADPREALPADMVVSLNDFRLRNLHQRRDDALLRVHEAEAELTNRQHQLSTIQSQLEYETEDSRIPMCQREISDIDALLRQLERRQLLEGGIASLEEELRRVRERMGQSDIVNSASEMLRELTDGEYRGLRVTSDHRCQVTDRENQTYDYSLLSRGVRDQVYLSLCLAIVQGYRRRHGDLPLILNDVFGNLDSAGTRSLVRVITRFAEQSQQVLVFTRHEHIRELFAATSARVFNLRPLDGRVVIPAFPPMPTVSTPPAPPVVEPRVPVAPRSEILPTPDPTYRWIAEWQRKTPTPTPLPVAPHVTPEPIVPPSPTRTSPEKKNQDPPTAGLLNTASMLTAVPTLSADFVHVLNEVDVHRVDEFLELDPEFVEENLNEQGLTADIIQRRQREILMLIYVAVSPVEAQLLVACGVPDPERLARADEDVLLRRIATILERPQAEERFGSISQYPADRVQSWIESARRSDYATRAPRTVFQAENSSRSRNGKRSRSQRSSRHTAPDSSPSVRKTVRMNPSTKQRFYLDVQDQVVDAPSIGPKTAERLNEVDVFTVADLLAADPQGLASRLDDKRISAKTVRQWQQQAQLVCRIPNLRGHDAQILVACGIDDPAELATLDASELLEEVGEFVSTKEGQRVLRNGKRPDLAEVTAWIAWSESARQLRAA